jgi:hypothetical protein
MSSTVLKDTTPLSAAGFFIDLNMMRPRGSTPDKRVMESFGGWQKALTTTLNGKARGCITYKDGSSITTHSIGTHIQIYGWQDSTLLDITPFTSYDNSHTNALSTTADSKEVRFAWTSHSFTAGDRFEIRTTTSIGGVTISAGAAFTVTSIATSTFTFDMATSAVATSASTGGSIRVGIFLVTGLEYSTGGPGWGQGVWGGGTATTWGGAASPVNMDFDARTHTMSRWGTKNLQVCPSKQTLFEWNGIFTTPAELLVSTWNTTSGWTGSGATVLNAVSGLAADTTQGVALAEGAFHRLEFDVTSVGTGGAFLVLCGTVSITTAVTDVGLYTYEFFKVSGDLTFRKSVGFSGDITGISVKQMERLAAVPDAPAQNNVMCVTDENITMVGGATDPSTGEYSPMLLRWSDQFGNRLLTVPANQVWIASSTNQAGAYILTNGGRIVAIRQWSGEVLIWTDKALYRAIYTPDPRIIYRIRKVADNCGAMSSRSITSLEGVLYWMSPSGLIYGYSSGKPMQIPFTAQDDTFGGEKFTQQALIHASPTAKEGEVLFYYPHKDDGGNEVSRYVGVTSYGETFVGKMSRTCRQDAGITKNPWAVDENGQVFWHELGHTGNDAAIGESFDTGLIGIGSGETLAQVDRFLSDFKSMVGNFQLTIKTWMYANDQNPTSHGPFNVTPTTTKIDTGFLVGMYISFHGVASVYPSKIRFGTPMANITDTGMIPP